MAFNKDNFFQEGNSEEAFLSRTNPLANAANAEILKVEECGACDIELNVTVQTLINPFTGEKSTSVTFGAPTTGYTDLSAAIIQITDGEGNFAYGSGDSAIDTTALNASVLWIVTIYIARGENGVLTCVCSKKFNFKHDPQSSIATVIDTETMGLGILRGFEDGGTTPLLTLEFTGAAGSLQLSFDWDLGNIGEAALKVTTIDNLTGDIDAVNFDTAALGVETLYPNDKRNMTVRFTGVSLAGSYSGTADFTLSDGTVVTITFNLTVS